MFGYIIPDKPELKIKEYELFKAYYCGLCKCISSNYGQVPRFALNYDCVFLGLLLSSVCVSGNDIYIGSCITKPMKKIPVIKEDSILKYAAGMNIILAYYNLKDDIQDNKLNRAPLIPLLYPAYKKARADFPETDKVISHCLAELNSLEKNRCDNMDAACEPFANLLAEVVSGVSHSDDSMHCHLRQLGYNIGKWLYAIDALDDITDDIKKKNYNPLAENYFKNITGNEELFHDGIPDEIVFLLRFSLKQAGVAYESLPVKKNKSILDNIMYGGLYNKTEQVLKKAGKKENINERSI